MPNAAFRPPIQPLEPRRLFAAGMVVTGHQLTVTGDPRMATTITVGLSADGASVVATLAYQTGRGTHVVPHSGSKTFPLANGITSVEIIGGSGADSITVDQTNGSFPLPVSVHAGAGNDTVRGGDEPDAFWGQGGNDLLVGGGGNDSLYGMAGRDTLIGGDGADYLSGGTGRDSLEGDAGNDTLYDPFGPDVIMGGPFTAPTAAEALADPVDATDDNTFDLASLRRDPVNDFNDTKDTLHIVPVPHPDASNPYSVGNILGTVFSYV